MNAMYLYKTDSPEPKFFKPVHIELPEPMIEIEVKPIQILNAPRIEKREHTADEQATAKRMMDKLRRRDDLLHLVRHHALPDVIDRDSAIDVVVDRLLSIVTDDSNV